MSTGLAEAAVSPSREPGVYPKGDSDWEVVPARLGPVWDKDPTWDGPRDPEGYILPHLTIGWQAIRWGENNLLSDDIDPVTQRRLPFQLTAEQMRFVLWFYAIDERGRFAYREVILQRLKGWGKDPLAAFIAAVEFVGPCRFSGWATASSKGEHAALRDMGLTIGDPVAKPHPRAWVQVAAVSQTQTKNTMLLFNGLFTDECKAEHGIDIGQTVIYAYGGMKQIEAVTRNPRSLEGNRPTLVIKNETHHWVDSNFGTAMARAIERNATKAKGGAARTLSITNAPDPSEESVAMGERDAYELIAAGDAMDVGMLYDSLEAPASARLRPKFDDDVEAEMSDQALEELTRRYLRRILEEVVGDAWWLDIPSLIDSILSPNKDNTASMARRWWFNQITGSEDSWVDPRAVDASINKLAAEARATLEISDTKSILEAGWLVMPDEPIVVFFDGSKSHDATGLVGCRLRDGYIFTIGVWSPPRTKDKRKGWTVNRDAVDRRVYEAFTRFNVVAFWADPSHTQDDDNTSYWVPYIDKWMRDFKNDDPMGRWKALATAWWPVKSGLRQHAVMFDMASADRQKVFIAAAEEFVVAMENLNDIEEFAPTFQIDGHPMLVTHLKNARDYLHPLGGTSLMKDGRESLKKIDLAVCAVGARMLRRIVLNSEQEEEEPVDNEIWGAL